MRTIALLGVLIAVSLSTGCNRASNPSADDRISDSSWDDRGERPFGRDEDPFQRDARHEYRREADDVELVSERPERRYDRDPSTSRTASRSELAAERAEDAADAAADRFVQDPDGDDEDQVDLRRSTTNRRLSPNDTRLNERTGTPRERAAAVRRPSEQLDDVPRSRAARDEIDEAEQDIRSRRPAGDRLRQPARIRDEN